MQLYRVKYLKCLRTRKYNLEHKCEWNLTLAWLFLAPVTFYLNCLHRVDLVHPFWAMAAFPVSFSVLSCWINTAPSMCTKGSSWIWKNIPYVKSNICAELLFCVSVTGKTKYMVISRERNAGRDDSVKIDNSTIERVEEFKYLGLTLTDQNSIQE
jgi:hypothetical protein